MYCCFKMTALLLVVLAALTFCCATAEFKFLIPNFEQITEGIDQVTYLHDHPDSLGRIGTALAKINFGVVTANFTGLDETWAPAKYITAFLLQQYISDIFPKDELTLEDVLYTIEYLKKEESPETDPKAAAKKQKKLSKLSSSSSGPFFPPGLKDLLLAKANLFASFALMKNSATAAANAPEAPPAPAAASAVN